MLSLAIILSTLFIVDLIKESRCPCSMNRAFSSSREAEVEYRLLGESAGDWEARYCKWRRRRALRIWGYFKAVAETVMVSSFSVFYLELSMPPCILLQFWFFLNVLLALRLTVSNLTLAEVLIYLWLLLVWSSQELPFFDRRALSFCLVEFWHFLKSIFLFLLTECMPSLLIDELKVWESCYFALRRSTFSVGVFFSRIVFKVVGLC